MGNACFFSGSWLCKPVRAAGTIAVSQGRKACSGFCRSPTGSSWIFSIIAITAGFDRLHSKAHRKGRRPASFSGSYCFFFHQSCFLPEAGSSGSFRLWQNLFVIMPAFFNHKGAVNLLQNQDAAHDVSKCQIGQFPAPVGPGGQLF